MHFGTICTFGGIICNHLLFTFVFCFYRLPCTQKIQAPPVRRFADRGSLLYHFYSVSVSSSPANSSSVVPCNLTNTLRDNSSKYETSKYSKAHSIYYMTPVLPSLANMQFKLLSSTVNIVFILRMSIQFSPLIFLSRTFFVLIRSLYFLRYFVFVVWY